MLPLVLGCPRHVQDSGSGFFTIRFQRDVCVHTLLFWPQSSDMLYYLLQNRKTQHTLPCKGHLGLSSLGGFQFLKQIVVLGMG